MSTYYWISGYLLIQWIQHVLLQIFINGFINECSIRKSCPWIEYGPSSQSLTNALTDEENRYIYTSQWYLLRKVFTLQCALHSLIDSTHIV